MQKHGKNMSKFKEIIDLLVKEKELPRSAHDHPLRGNWTGYRDLHLEPDWILIYKIDRARQFIRFERTGTHSELF